jgi:hypoxanthine phosphoribosyltransferase
MKNIVIGNDVYIPFISEEKIQAKVKALAKKIEKDYKDKIPLFIGILNDSFIFLSDLLKNYNHPCEVDFIKISSYKGDKLSGGKVKILNQLNCSIKGRDVIIVEDIVDSGLSVKFIKELLAGNKPSSIKVVSLLVKPKSIKFDIKIDYIGINIPSKFVIGYGLDYNQKFRNLKSIYILNK